MGWGGGLLLVEKKRREGKETRGRENKHQKKELVEEMGSLLRKRIRLRETNPKDKKDRKKKRKTCGRAKLQSPSQAGTDDSKRIMRTR